MLLKREAGKQNYPCERKRACDGACPLPPPASPAEILALEPSLLPHSLGLCRVMGHPTVYLRPEPEPS